MERVYKPIVIKQKMIDTKSFTIPIDKENFIAILKKDNEIDFEETLCGQLYKILGHDNADYSAGFVGTNIYIDVDVSKEEELLKKVEACIDKYTLEARVESDFFSDGES